MHDFPAERIETALAWEDLVLNSETLGKHIGKDVYRIHLSRIVSKFIGETAKNLSRVLDEAEHEDWILFFDEAEVLFGKRTNVQDAHDRFANLQIASLQQRIEQHRGLVILATHQCPTH